jgi:hypothetical protein
MCLSSLFGSTVKKNYGAPGWKRDRPIGPSRVLILLAKECGQLCPHGKLQRGDAYRGRRSTAASKEDEPLYKL